MVLCREEGGKGDGAKGEREGGWCYVQGGRREGEGVM